jgi:hypothetical protein
MTSKFPEWLPPIVATMAQRCVSRASNHDDRKLALRLATDDRMRSVWRELSRCEPPEGQKALGRFFEHARAHTHGSYKTVSVSELTDWGAACKRQAEALRASARFVYETEQYMQSRIIDLLRPHLLPDQLSQASFEVQSRMLQGARVEDAAEYLDSLAAATPELCAAGHPLVIDRDQGNRRTRGYVRALAGQTRSMFGSPLYGTLATTANVALSPSIPVTAKQVRNWCSANKNP